MEADVSKKRKVEDPLTSCSPARRVRLMSTSEDNNKDVPENREGSGQAPSAPDLVSIATVRSPAKPKEEEGVDSGAFRDLEELLDEAVPSGSKTGSNIFSGSKSSMRRDCGKGSTGKSRIGD